MTHSLFRSLLAISGVFASLIVPNFLRPAAMASAASTLPICIALDRSGSIASTDPQQYSPSVLDLVADLAATSRMTVFTFSGIGSTGVHQLGTFDLVDGSQRGALHRQVTVLASTPVGGNTPTAALVTAIQQYLTNQNAPAGSGCIIVSDGEPEPDSSGQYAQIQASLPSFAAHHWKLHAIALGSGPWTDRFLRMAQQLGGASLRASSPAQLLGVALHAFAEYTQDAPPHVEGITLDANGNADVPIQLDPTIKKLTVLVTRQDRTLTATLHSSSDSVISQNDPRTIGFNDADRHYEFWNLASHAALGAGRWTVKIHGTPGSRVWLAFSERSDLNVRLVKPTSGLVLADRPQTVCAELLDGSQPLAVSGATVTATIAGQTTRLLDNGQAANGDAYADDGTFCNHVSLPAGGQGVQVRAVTPGNGQAAVDASLYAVVMPGFQLVTPTTVPTVHDGESAALPFAQFALNGGRVNPAIIKALSIVIKPPAGPDRLVSLNPRSALDSNGVVTVSVPADLADAAPGTRDGPDAGRRIPYTVILQAGYGVDGQVISDPTAAVQSVPINVIPWPVPCGLLPGTAVRAACTPIATFPPLRVGAMVVLAGLLGLALLTVAIRLIFGRRDSDDIGGAMASGEW